MRRLLIILFGCLFFLPSVCFAAKTLSLERQLKSDAKQRYYILLPASYVDGEKYPLMIAIHWYQGRAKKQVTEWGYYSNKENFILLCPQFKDGYQRFKNHEDEKLIEIIDEIKDEIGIDTKKVFLVGFSGGAEFAYRFAFQHPEVVDKVCVLAAESYSLPPAPKEEKRIKYFIAAGRDDENFKKTESFYELLEKKGYDAFFESYELVVHSLHANMKRDVARFLRTDDEG